MFFLGDCTLPETNSEFTPENGWLEYDRFLLGPGLFSGASCFGEGRKLEKKHHVSEQLLI